LAGVGVKRGTIAELEDPWSGESLTDQVHDCEDSCLEDGRVGWGVKDPL
jgi:hypothetical protein